VPLVARNRQTNPSWPLLRTSCSLESCSTQLVHVLPFFRHDIFIKKEKIEFKHRRRRRSSVCGRKCAIRPSKPLDSRAARSLDSGSTRLSLLALHMLSWGGEISTVLLASVKKDKKTQLEYQPGHASAAASPWLSDISLSPRSHLNAATASTSFLPLLCVRNKRMRTGPTTAPFPHQR